ncbi:MAG: hypothetical protein V8R81_04485 [Clostridia bacterium]
MQIKTKINRENQVKNITRRQTGITLIALIITIIILLILAGVSIAMLTGNNGILTQAKLAKENTEAAKEQEEKDLDKMNSYINEKTIKDNYTDINGDKATIPEGFSVDENENVISKGLVVNGPDKANGDNGSEFVWVPVTDINSMAQCSTAGENCNLQLEDGVLKCKTHNDNEEIIGKLYATVQGENFGTVNTIYDANNGFREPAILTGNSSGTGNDYDNNLEYNNNLFSLEDLKTDYKNMATSVAKYGEFYVGRYETSLSEAKNGKAQSKQVVIPTSAANSGTSMWYGLYTIQNKTYIGTNNSVESSMIWGSQYDAIINWVKNGTDKEKISITSLGNNSSGSVVTTGMDTFSNDSINSIRDLCGNLSEWTLEAYGNGNRIYRGGYYNSKVSPGARYSNSTYGTSNNFGSRMSLYIK